MNSRLIRNSLEAGECAMATEYLIIAETLRKMGKKKDEDYCSIAPYKEMLEVSLQKARECLTEALDLLYDSDDDNF